MLDPDGERISLHVPQNIGRYLDEGLLLAYWALHISFQHSLSTP
jgi:hypothetical protein